MTRPRKIPAQAGFEPGIFHSRGRHLTTRPTRRWAGADSCKYCCLQPLVLLLQHCQRMMVLLLQYCQRMLVLLLQCCQRMLVLLLQYCQRMLMLVLLLQYCQRMLAPVLQLLSEGADCSPTSTVGGCLL